jgi:hypothetical protein
VFENGLLITNQGHRQEEITGWSGRKLHNEMFHNLFYSPYIIEDEPRRPR